jgi:hypothetical protein
VPIRGHPSWMDGAVGTRRARFPRSRISGRRGRHPAVPLRPRHGYAVDLHRDLPGQPSRTSREFPDDPRTADRRVRTAHQPESTGLELAILEEASDAGSSRMPSRLAHRARSVRQYRTAPALSRLLPPSPPSRGSGCRPLYPATTMAKASKLFHLQPENTCPTCASWRT